MELTDLEILTSSVPKFIDYVYELSKDHEFRNQFVYQVNILGEPIFVLTCKNAK